jgi:hypothetical protein
VDSAYPVNLVHRAVRQRHDVERAIGPGDDVDADAEVASEQQGFAFGDVELGQVVGDAVFQTRVVDGNPSAVTRQVGSGTDDRPRFVSPPVRLSVQ